MKRLAKNVAAVCLGLSLLCPGAAYGAEMPGARELFRQVEESQKNVNDMNAFYDFDISVSGSLLDEAGLGTLKMRMEMNAMMSGIQDPQNMRMMTYSRMTMEDGSQMTSTAYFLDGMCYTDSMGMKYSYPMPMEEMMSQSQELAEILPMSEDMVSSLTLAYEGENRVVSFKMDDELLNDYMSEIMGMIGSELPGGAAASGMNIQMRDVRGSYVVNPAGQLVKMRMNMAMDMGVEGESFTFTMDGDVGIADPGQPVNVPVPNPAEYQDLDAALAGMLSADAA